jgi:hypothetical protein
MNTKEFLTTRISELEKELQALKRALMAYENTASTNIAIKEEILNIDKPKIYEGTWIENILCIIKDKNRFLHNDEMAQELYATYSDKEKGKVKRRISAVLSSAFSKGEIESLTNYRFSKSRKDTVWGKKEWLDEDGKIKKEYLYKNKDNSSKSIAIDF